MPEEQARVRARRAKWVKGDKAATTRPDTKCLKALRDKNIVSPEAERVWGHLPGIPIGHRQVARVGTLHIDCCVKMHWRTHLGHAKGSNYHATPCQLLLYTQAPLETCWAI